MKNIKISIVIPIYNVEKYLRQCLESVINQTYKNLEIICIDDGSPDNSIEILKDYENKDERIKIIRQENKGLAETRNVGIKNTTGEFIFFLDSDDWLPLNAIEILLNTQQKMKSDIVIGGRINVIGEQRNSFIPRFEDKNYCFEEYLINSLKTNQFRPAAWGKLYRTDIIKKYDFKFPKGYLYEDLLFVFLYLYYSKKIYTLSENVYYYRRDRGTSIINNLNKKDIDCLKSIEKIEKFLKEKNENDLLNNIYFQKYIFEWIMYATIGKFYIMDINYNIFKLFIWEIKENKSFQKYSKLYKKIPLKYVEKLKNKYVMLRNKIYILLIFTNIRLAFIFDKL